MVASDIRFMARRAKALAKLRVDDARKCATVPSGWATLVITSPPYANNYDYADATRLEMAFMGEIRGWGDARDVAAGCLWTLDAKAADGEEFNLGGVAPIAADALEKHLAARVNLHWVVQRMPVARDP